MDNARELKYILVDYCKMSGQKVNVSKSPIYCGIDTDNVLSRQVAKVFGMTLVTDPGKYMGLPSLWGRSKCESLNFLETRITNKIQGRKTKLLNNAGKVMIKRSSHQYLPML